MKRRSKFGWMELIIGILLIVLGIFTFFAAGRRAVRGGIRLWPAGHHHGRC